MAAGNPTACLLVIGNEVLSGRTQDANIRFLALSTLRAAFSSNCDVRLRHSQMTAYTTTR